MVMKDPTTKRSRCVYVKKIGSKNMSSRKNKETEDLMKGSPQKSGFNIKRKKSDR